MAKKNNKNKESIGVDPIAVVFGGNRLKCCQWVCVYIWWCPTKFKQFTLSGIYKGRHNSYIKQNMETIIKDTKKYKN